MAITNALLSSCHAQIVASVAYSTFTAAHAAFVAGSRTARPALWHAAYGDAQAGLSPAYRLKKFIRDTVAGLAASTVTPSERETAYQTLVAQYVTTPNRPNNVLEEQAELQKLLTEDAAS